MVPDATRPDETAITRSPFPTAVTAPQAEIGLLIYPGCLLWSVHGLTDLFRVAGERAGPGVPPLRVSHWQATESGVACVWDSHPGTGHRLAYIVSPSSIMAPAQMAAQPVAADWMHQRHAEG